MGGGEKMYKTDIHTDNTIGTITKHRRNENKDKCNKKKGRFRMTFVAGYVSQLTECSYVEIENI